MLIHPWDSASPEEWHDLVRGVSFGQVVAWDPRELYPTVVPTHFVLDDDAGRVLLHLARANPIWRAIEHHPHVVLSVASDYVYVEAAWNAGSEAPPERGVPTSYYAAAQLRCRAEIVDDPERKLQILRAQLDRFEPAGSERVPPTSEVESDGRLLPGIRGLVLTIEAVQAKMKYGGNRSLEHRDRIAEHLEARGGPMDAAARAHLLRRGREAEQGTVG